MSIFSEGSRKGDRLYWATSLSRDGFSNLGKIMVILKINFVGKFITHNPSSLKCLIIPLKLPLH